MDATEVDRLVRQLSAGFASLQDEYQKLYGQHQVLERKLATARAQYNELARLYGTVQTATPPLSLSSSAVPAQEEACIPTSIPDILDGSSDHKSCQAAAIVREGCSASQKLLSNLPTVLEATSHDGVKIWAGSSADKVEGSTCLMPSISESPLEQDFTVAGKPSRLGCPFASMANKQLSSHAASVLSRYNHSNSGGAASTPVSTTSRINGRESLSRRQSRRASFVDPIKAEICGLSDHGSRHVEPAPEEREESSVKTNTGKHENAEPGVCPIRFLDQHSPEEVATYFENHKHELPRSHEVCVMRYQSNAEQIRELDAKYGNLVSMIQGLGQKHKDMLPEEPDEGDAEDVLDDAQVRKWASSVSAQAPEATVDDEPEERQPHFERPLRDIRVGESPSRPWGIPVPAKYLEDAQSETSSRPVYITQAAMRDASPTKRLEFPQGATEKPAGKCPFDHGAATNTPSAKPAAIKPISPKPEALPSTEAEPPPIPHAKPVIINDNESNPPRMVFTGPVFIGCSPEDAAKILGRWKTS